MTFVERIEGIILHCLVFMLLTSVVMGTVELGRSLVVIAMTPPPLMIDPSDLTRLFGLFLVILIGLELLKLIKLHMSHDMVRPELVIEVAIIAVCNKVVTLDPKTMTANDHGRPRDVGRHAVRGILRVCDTCDCAAATARRKRSRKSVSALALLVTQRMFLETTL